MKSNKALVTLIGFWMPLMGLISADQVSFSRDVLPILSENCFYCHGPDEDHRKAGLRLDVETSALALVDGEAAVKPGKPKDSLVIKRVFSKDPDEIMPPPDSLKELSPEEQQTLQQWIAAGAPWGKHWAFEPPTKSEIPISGSHPIDYFIQQRLGLEGWTLAEEAPRHTLLRRLSFDLTGLPPSHAEVNDFERDPSPDAHFRQVERLLRSPHHGERMAMWWLDAARYADTDGFQGDATRANWPWRDWVVQAFNENMPFDQFTVEQFAGDLLPDATTEQILATSFHRNHMTNGEGGRDPEESRIDYVIDRVNTVGTIWMGMTVGCAQCHSHKFDPLSHKEYYQLNAYFNNIDEDGRAGSGAKPFLNYKSPLGEAHLKAGERQITQARRQLDHFVKRAQPEFEAWLSLAREEVSNGFTGWHPLKPEQIESVEGSEFVINSGHIVTVKGPNPRQDDYHLQSKPSLSRVTGIRLEVFSDPSHTKGRYGRGVSGEFILTNVKLLLVKEGSQVLREIPLVKAIADFEAKPAGGEKYGKVKDTLDDDPRNGWSTRGDELSPSRIAVFALEEPLQLAEDESLDFVMMHRSTLGDANMGRFRVSISDQPGEAVRRFDPMPLAQLASIVNGEGGAVTLDLRRQLEQQFLEDHPSYQKEKVRFERMKAHFDELKQAIASQKVMVLGEREKTRETHVLVRGVWDNKGEVVQPGLPAAIRGGASKEAGTRRELAEWLVSRENPLTSRVIVNHLWQLVFGAGLVRTPDDFGLQGEQPTHPDLLDWLAVELMESGWDVRHMLRLMVTSQTYQQSSHVVPDLFERDPYNRLWARASRHRLPSWMLHDAVLKTSGLLNPILGGPSVRPFQPVGIWQDIFMGRFTYRPSPGSARYRRMLYSFWRRTSAPAFLFDQAQRRVCEVRTRLTNTPLQALTLLNDEAILEAAHALSGRFLLEGKNEEEGLRLIGQEILCRDLHDQEWAVILAKWKEARKHYSGNPDEARSLLTIGQQIPISSLDAVEHASMMWVANMIFNLDEAITHE